MPQSSRNLAQSVQRRLLNKARERKEDPNLVLIRYALERFLYRLGRSVHKDRFVLKGAMLFAAWPANRIGPPAILTSLASAILRTRL